MQRSRSAVVAAVGLAAAALGLRCAFSHDDWARAYNRDQLNKETSECMSRQYLSCKGLGDDLMGKSARSRQSDWTEPTDRGGAKQAYATGCSAGLGDCCRAIVEQDLAASPAEKHRFEIMASYYGAEVRSSAELAAEEEHILAQVEKAETRLTATRAAERADHEAQTQAILGVATNTAQALAQTAVALQSHPAPRSAPPPSTAAPPAPGAAASRPPARAPTQFGFASVGAGKCAGLGAACGPPICCDGPAEREQLRLRCEANRCCEGFGAFCQSDADCCGAPVVTCTPDVTGNRHCCKGSGLRAQYVEECCSGYLDPKTSYATCQ